MDEKRLELKAGAFTLVALASLVGLLVVTGELTLGKSDELVVDFAHTGNVVKNAPVKLGGVVVGKVGHVELLATRVDAAGSPLPVRMTLAVSTELLGALRRDAVVTVSSQGPLGEAYLELWPGVDPSPFPPHTPLRGSDAPRLDIVSARLAKVLDSTARVLDADPDALGKLLRGVGGLSASADGVLTDNREALKTITSELAAAAKDLRALTAAAKKQLDPSGPTASLLADAAASARLARTELPALTRDASAALATYQSAGEKVDSVAARADRLLARLEAGEGTLGALAKDKQAYDDLKSLLGDLKAHPWKLLWKD
jgi:phospholipid/cholesterol/gamma-HCH transport system substrate-binding protein